MVSSKVFGFFLILSFATAHCVPCDIRARTEAGWVCGLRRWSEDGQVYASFRGVPYAKQPVGELRFKELQPVEHWKQDLDAREEGPVCIQHDEVYGSITTPEYGMSEACIHANIHVPLYALPKHESYNTDYDWSKKEKTSERSTYYLPDDHKKHEKGFEYPLIKYKTNTEEKSVKIIENYQKNNANDYKQSLHNLLKHEEIGENNNAKVQNAWFNANNNGAERYNWKNYRKPETKGNYGKRRYFWRNYEKPEPKEKYTTERYFWKNNEKSYNKENQNADILEHYEESDDKEDHNSRQGVGQILKTWSEYQNQEYEEGSKYTSNKFHNKRHSFDTSDRKHDDKKYLPILVFIHGGGFNAGSGDADLHGPEYLVSKDVIVITFNYRINVFGFLSLNTSKVPGNNGLRDQIALLHWVQRNAKNFGGDPHDVTLMGQSAGATCAHLLSLSDAAIGLFKRVILLSGTAYQGFYTTSPIYAATIAANFLAILGITTADPDEIYTQLTHIPIKRIIEANSLLQAQYGLVTFTPVVETRFSGVTKVLDKDPETLIAEGKGKEYPVIIGCTTVEAETFRRRLGYERYVSRALANPRILLPAGISFSTPQKVSLALGQKAKQRCFGEEPSLDGVVNCFGEIAFIYQAFRLARERARMHAAPTFLYQFSYESDLNLIQKGIKLKYKGAAHIEDLTYVFRVNSLLEPKSDFPPKDRDDKMKDWMSDFVVNFMYCSDPTCSKHSQKSGWPPVTKDHLVYEDIRNPYVFKVLTPTRRIQEMIRFYDKIYALSGMPSINGTKF